MSEEDKNLPSQFDTLKTNLETRIAKWRSSAEQAFDASLQSFSETYLNTRQPVPPALLDQVSPLPYATAHSIRTFDTCPQFEADNVLTLSGGGSNGAYGAGVLAGWTQRGSRPEFDVVMGVSTGAIIGLFAFMGMAYDSTLRHFYTAYATEDLATRQMLHGITLGASMYDNAKLAGLLTYYIDEVAIQQLADAHQHGRALLVATTNLDRSLAVTWNLTAIAHTGDLHATALIRHVILASCAIPVAFPPVLLPVFDAHGNQFDEMHVDGGATQQMMTDLPAHRANVFALVNNRLTQPYAPVDVAMLDIANKSLSNLIAGSVTHDLHRLHANCQQRQSQYRATWIDDTFTASRAEMFDRAYMRELYEFGFKAGITGNAWHHEPPNS